MSKILKQQLKAHFASQNVPNKEGDVTKSDTRKTSKKSNRGKNTRPVKKTNEDDEDCEKEVESDEQKKKTSNKKRMPSQQSKQGSPKKKK